MYLCICLYLLYSITYIDQFLSYYHDPQAKTKVLSGSSLCELLHEQ
jgi:hypothetical protein